MLSDLLPDAPTILYLESDLIINIDACAFFDHQLENFPIAAIDAETVEWCVDHSSPKTWDRLKHIFTGIGKYGMRSWSSSKLDFGGAISWLNMGGAYVKCRIPVPVLCPNLAQAMKRCLFGIASSMAMMPID